MYFSFEIVHDSINITLESNTITSMVNTNTEPFRKHSFVKKLILDYSLKHCFFNNTLMHVDALKTTHCTNTKTHLEYAFKLHKYEYVQCNNALVVAVTCNDDAGASGSSSTASDLSDAGAPEKGGKWKNSAEFFSFISLSIK